MFDVGQVIDKKRLEELEKKEKLYDAFENAAKDLPEGFSIRISIENGYGGVDGFVDIDGIYNRIETADKTIAEQIDIAVCEITDVKDDY